MLAPSLLSPPNLLVKEINGDKVTCRALLEYFKVRNSVPCKDFGFLSTYLQNGEEFLCKGHDEKLALFVLCHLLFRNLMLIFQGSRPEKTSYPSQSTLQFTELRHRVICARISTNTNTVGSLPKYPFSTARNDGSSWGD